MYLNKFEYREGTNTFISIDTAQIRVDLSIVTGVAESKQKGAKNGKCLIRLDDGTVWSIVKNGITRNVEEDKEV